MTVQVTVNPEKIPPKPQPETVKPKPKRPTQSIGDFTRFIPERKDEEKKTPQETPTAKGAPVENKGKKSSLTKKSVQTTKNSTERVNGHDAPAKKATTKKLPATGGAVSYTHLTLPTICSV